MAGKFDVSVKYYSMIMISILVVVICFYTIIGIDIPPKSLKCALSWKTKTKIDCDLSMRESDEWFCETDDDWTRRKSLHHDQDQRNRVSDSRTLFFQNNWEPTVQCAFERRIGRSGDGGKWVCDIHRYLENNQSNSLIYSFGSNGDFSFETALKHVLPQADIHTFDMGVYTCPVGVCTFHQARLGTGKGDGSKSLRTVIEELKHQNRIIEILKVDIEGSEFDLFEQFFASANSSKNKIYIRQILFEIHINNFLNEEGSRRTHRLFEIFRANHYVIFHKEVNLYDPQNVFEYALLRLNPQFFVKP